MDNSLTSRDRMRAAIKCEPVDYIPCCFMLFDALRSRCATQREFIERQVELGLDTVVNLPDLPITFSPEVKVREWQEVSASGCVILHKAYETPAGTLTAAVSPTPDWPHGEHVPLCDDYLIPRSTKFLVTHPADLPALRYLFSPPATEQIQAFREETVALKRFAAKEGLLVVGGWGGWGHGDLGLMGVDGVMWLCGMQQPIFWGLEEPESLEELISVLADWNRSILDVYLNAGIDLCIKRAWYETTDLWSPALYSRFILPILKNEVSIAHQAGVPFACIMTSGVMPLAEALLQSGLDVLIGVDPVQGKGTTLARIKDSLGKKMCLWGGVNGFLTVEQGSTKEIEDAVHQAITLLAPGGGFILSPVDNVRDTSEEVWRNVETLISAWKRYRTP